MNGLERTLEFIKGNPVDRLPYHPMVMRIVSELTGVNYRDYCLDPQIHSEAAIQMSEMLQCDWITVMSDPYAEAEAFGLPVEYPDNAMPHESGLLILDPMTDIDKLTVPNIQAPCRMRGRVEEIEHFARLGKDRFFIVGWVEGPVAEYADLRGLGMTCLDFFDCPDKVHQAIEIILENAINLITAQVKAGAHCIGIGEAVCSQIGPDIYKEFGFKGDKILVDHIHSLGALAKIHICGDTSDIMPQLVATGADIIDVDHLAKDIGKFATLLNPGQVLSGNVDPVAIVANGSPEIIKAAVKDINEKTNNRTIVSAGCEIPPGTPMENMKAFQESTKLKI
jgi:MtaA/CmuA family methyltransferase